jgi:hypothetical protein
MSAMREIVSATFGFDHLPPEQFRAYSWYGWYAKIYQAWLDSDRYDVFTKYELLDDFNELRRIVYELTGDMLPEERVKQSMERQSFTNLAPQFPHSMRKGIVGDWKNHFKPEHCEYITMTLGRFMLEQNYIKSLDWWQNEQL